MWKTLRKLWDAFRHLKAFRDLLEALTLLKYVLAGASVVVGTALAVWSWVIHLPGPVVVLIGLAGTLLLMMLFSYVIRRLSELHKPSAATQDAVGMQSKPTLALGIIATVLVLGIIGWIASRYHKADGASNSPTATAAVPKQPAASPVPTPTPIPPPAAEASKPKTRTKVPTKEESPTADPSQGITLGKDAVALGHVPDGSKIGDGSVIVGATDANGNVKLTQGGLAVGKGATADPTSIAIGAGACAGNCGPPPLHLTWSIEPKQSEDKTFRFLKQVKVTPNVEWHPVSLIIICDQEIKDVNVGGVMFGPDFGVTQQSNKTGYVYYKDPGLAPGESLIVSVFSDREFNIVTVTPANIKPRKNAFDPN